MDIARNKAVVAQFDELDNRGGDLSMLDTLCTIFSPEWARR
jgi:hypothetical protein